VLEVYSWTLNIIEHFPAEFRTPFYAVVDLMISLTELCACAACSSPKASTKQGEMGPNKRQKKGDKNGSNPRLSRADVDLILCWLEIDGNIDKIHGSEKTTKVSGKVPAKMEGYKELTAYFNCHKADIKGFVPYTPLSMKNRWKYHFNKYRKTKELNDKETGWGVTDADRAKGITTIDQKNEALCSHYQRMDRHFLGKYSIHLNHISVSRTHGLMAA
jgi:hypothetical protein